MVWICFVAYLLGYLAAKVGCTDGIPYLPRTLPTEIRDNNLDFVFSTAVNSKTGSQNSLLRDKLPMTSTGTTIVGLCCKDGVVLGSDTRSTGGSVVMDKNVLKIHYIAPSIRCCAAGTSADCEYLSNEAQRVVALADLDCQLSGDISGLGNVRLAIESIMKSLNRKIAGRGRTPSAVFIVGGVDTHGAHLYQIEGDGTPQRLPYATLGSGSLDAMSVLQNECSQLKMDPNKQVIDISMEDAVKIVRKAVQSGILNDLGSGSHVDLCCIEGSHGQVKQWREEMVNRFPSPQSLGAANELDSDDNEDSLSEASLGQLWKPTKLAAIKGTLSTSTSLPETLILKWKEGEGLVPKYDNENNDDQQQSYRSRFREINVDIL